MNCEPYKRIFHPDVFAKKKLIIKDRRWEIPHTTYRFSSPTTKNEFSFFFHINFQFAKCATMRRECKKLPGMGRGKKVNNDKGQKPVLYGERRNLKSSLGKNLY